MSARFFRQRVAPGLVAVAAIASVMPGGASAASQIGVGAAVGSVDCTPMRSNLRVASEKLLYGDTWRSVVASVASDGDCRVSGALILGAATLLGDGISCGANPNRPFTGYFVYTTGGVHLVGGFSGSCVVDGVERPSRFSLHGAAVDGRFAGYLLPTGDAPADF